MLSRSIERIRASAYRILTDRPESDGTLEWDVAAATTATVELEADVSLAGGDRVLLPAVRAARDDTLIVASGFSCREQISQCTDRRAIHLAEVIRMVLPEENRA